MSAVLLLAVSLAGGIGAALRLTLDGLIRGRFTSTLPIGTLTINITGSLILGLVTGLAIAHHLAAPVESVTGTGLMGGYTTFSTASFETVRLIQNRRYVIAVANGLGMLIVSIAAAGLGLWAGSHT
ncbi:fluoride efflux transporter CrcB [Curtobacterium flaccumfaciens]|jgi:CrcB protein|uniref:fluoride efflux transporter CrcB n=1 Tax=Curtobacterium flaccumfaciens TaxID=2035 RepID=UPI001BDEA680|nr:fluoride efflux transporter CrcB [Curtobacterium flaccumfaciens]MBT1631660.1 fluoride efflux transporter CrcB [Curtobacterium flaccumfaciens pv. oortii]MCX2844173.1 fluoride efflux transporter CrcB [Curtobacterium flaccumfaciens pv. oortii]